MSIQTDETNRISWACRRGMLELDLVLQGFFNHRYSELSEDEKLCFIKLLEENDDNLFAWLIKDHPAPEVHQDTVAKIAKHLLKQGQGAAVYRY